MRTLIRILGTVAVILADGGPVWAKARSADVLPLDQFVKHGGSVPWNIVVLLTLLTVLPALLLSMTPFVRLLVIFHFLRQALGTQSTPSNQTLIGLALILTYFLMQPVAISIQQAAVVPYEKGQVDAMQA